MVARFLRWQAANSMWNIAQICIDQCSKAKGSSRRWTPLLSFAPSYLPVFWHSAEDSFFQPFLSLTFCQVPVTWTVSFDRLLYLLSYWYGVGVCKGDTAGGGAVFTGSASHAGQLHGPRSVGSVTESKPSCTATTCDTRSNDRVRSDRLWGDFGYCTGRARPRATEGGAWEERLRKELADSRSGCVRTGCHWCHPTTVTGCSWFHPTTVTRVGTHCFAGPVVVGATPTIAAVAFSPKKGICLLIDRFPHLFALRMCQISGSDWPLFKIRFRTKQYQVPYISAG